MSAPVPLPDEQDAASASSTLDVVPDPVTAATGTGEDAIDTISLEAPENRNGRFQRIVKPVANFFGVQVIVQIVTMLSGLLLLRVMSKSEYAFYTIANTMQITIGILSDSGISAALSAIGGLVWQDKRRFGELIQTALEFRRRFGVAVFFIIGPLMWWLLYSNGAGIFYSSLLSIIVLSSSSLSLIHGVLVVVPRLNSRFKQIQNAELMLATLRLSLVGLASFLFLDAAVAVTIYMVTLAIQNFLYRRWAKVDADLSAPTNVQDRKKIWEMVRFQAPNSIFACLQGQIFVVLIGFFGNTTDVANVGALFRLTVIFTIVHSMMTNMVLPRFARCQVKSQLKQMYFQIIGFYFFISAILISAVAIMPAPFLWLLGNKYANLQSELIYFAFATCAAAMAGILFALVSTRGWLKYAWLSIPITLGSQILMIPFLDLSSIQNIALLGAIPSLLGAIPYVYQAYISIDRFDAEKIAV